MADEPSGLSPDASAFAARVALATAVVITILLGLWIAWYAIDVLLLVFAGALLATFLYALTEVVMKVSFFGEKSALAVVILVLLGGATLAGWAMAPTVAEEVEALSRTLPQAFQEIQAWFLQYEWGQTLFEQVPTLDELFAGRTGWMGQVTGFFTTTFGLVANLVILLGVALFLAANPSFYKEGLIQLFPHSYRERAREVAETLGTGMKRWLLGRAASMVLVGALVWFAMWLLDVPLALVLGIIAGFFTFVPYLGPIIGAVPAIGVGLTVSPMTAVWVALAYFIVEQIESIALVPIVQQVAVKVPPALTIVSQVLLGVLFGLPGLVLATPLTAVLLVLVKMMYIEDVLGDKVDVFGTGGEEAPA